MVFVCCWTSVRVAVTPCSTLFLLLRQRQQLYSTSARLAPEAEAYFAERIGAAPVQVRPVRWEEATSGIAQVGPGGRVLCSKGLFARERIEAGQCVLVEPPFVAAPHFAREHAFQARARSGMMKTTTVQPRPNLAGWDGQAWQKEDPAKRASFSRTASLVFHEVSTARQLQW